MFMVDIPILNGGYKPTYNWVGPPARPAPVAPVAPAQPPSLSQAAGRVMRLGMAVGNQVPWG